MSPMIIAFRQQQDLAPQSIELMITSKDRRPRVLGSTRDVGLQIVAEQQILVTPMPLFERIDI